MRHQWYRFVRCVLPVEKLKSRLGGQDSDYYSEYNARRFHSIKTYLIWLILSKNIKKFSVENTRKSILNSRDFSIRQKFPDLQ